MDFMEKLKGKPRAKAVLGSIKATDVLIKQTQQKLYVKINKTKPKDAPPTTLIEAMNENISNGKDLLKEARAFK